MTKTVEFYFDFGSPTAYLAHTQLPAIAERTGAQLEYRPMLLGGVFQAIGNASPAAVPAKGNYMSRDMPRCAAHWGVPFNANAPDTGDFDITNLATIVGAVEKLVADKAT